jgi:hypothetical protein
VVFAGDGAPFYLFSVPANTYPTTLALPDQGAVREVGTAKGFTLSNDPFFVEKVCAQKPG